MFVIVAVVTHIHEDENKMTIGMAVVELLDAVMTAAALAIVWKSARAGDSDQNSPADVVSGVPDVGGF